MSENNIPSVLDKLEALAEPNRVKIISLLEQGELCQRDITPHIGILQPTVSIHLLVLQNAGLVKKRKSGRRVYFSLTNPLVSKVLEDIGRL